MSDHRALAASLREIDAGRFHVVALPDFFLDHFVRVAAWSDVIPQWTATHARGGGNVATPHQHLQPGGNAANTALALARLGVRVHLVTRTSPFGHIYLEQTLGRMGVDVKHVKGDGALAITTAIEFHDDRPSNLMLSDPGSVARFGPEELDANDWTLLEAADLVVVTNWSQNRRGTALVEAVAAKAKRVMLDTGDPSVRGEDTDAGLREIKDRLLPLEDLDAFALNENELRQLAGRAIAPGAPELHAAREIAATRAGRGLDLHTARFAATFGDHGEAIVPTFRVEPLRVTGAGDAWNAGDALGHLAQLPPHERLTLANAVAGLYVSGKDGLAPTLADVVAFLESGPALNAL